MLCVCVCACAQGAPEGILERCTKARIAGKETVELNEQMKADILDVVKRYGSGADTLRCLALAVIDDPTKPEDMDLEDASNFVKYEVSVRISLLCLSVHTQWNLSTEDTTGTQLSCIERCP